MENSTNEGQNKASTKEAESVTMDLHQAEENGGSGEPHTRRPDEGSENSPMVTEKKTGRSPPSSPTRKEGGFMSVVAAATLADSFTSTTATAKPSIFHHHHHRRDSSTPAKKSFMNLVEAAVAAAARVESQDSTIETTPAMDAVAAGAAAAAQTNSKASTINPPPPILQKGDSNSGLSSSNNQTKKQHNRKISWGDDNVMTGGSRVSLSSSSFSTAGKLLSITDLVKQVNPLEQQAETHIISAIEDMEAMDKSRGAEDAPKNILEFVPPGAEGVFSDFAKDAKRDRSASGDAATTASLGQRTTQSRQPQPAVVRPERPIHRRNKTSVEEDLYSLGNALQALNRPDHLSPSSAQQQQPAVPEESMPYRADVVGGGSADRLAANAALLFRRKRSTQVLVDADGEVVSPLPSVASEATTNNTAGPATMASSTSNSRWKSISTAVHVSHALKNKKKTDEEHQIDGPSYANSGGGGVSGDQQQQQPPGDSFDMEIGGVTGTQLTNDNTEGDPSPTEATEPDGAGKKKRPMMSFLQGRLVMVSDYTSEKRYASVTFFSLLFVLVGIACILFYLAGNPPSKYTCVRRKAIHSFVY
jgi:hypothetical protein